MCGNTSQKRQIRKRLFVLFVRKNYVAYSGGTMNLCDHLTLKHTLQYFPTSRATTGSKTTTLDGFLKSSKCSESCAKSIMDRVSQMIVQDLRPIRIVEYEGFKNLLSYLEPGYTLPSQKQFSTDMAHKFELCKEMLRKHLETYIIKRLL